MVLAGQLMGAANSFMGLLFEKEMSKRLLYEKEERLQQAEACLFSFTINIPGPVKTVPLISKAFVQKISCIDRHLERMGSKFQYKEREKGKIK